MSLRPEIFAFDLDRLRSLIGCCDESLLHRARALLNDEIADINVRKTTFEVVERAVLRGVPFEGLVAEGSDHVTAAILMSKLDQSAVNLETSHWNMVPIWDLPKVFPTLAHRDHPYRFFIQGRPLFGPVIKTDWSYYGFLSHNEVVLVRDALALLRPRLETMPPLQPASPDTRAKMHAMLSAAQLLVDSDLAFGEFVTRLIAESSNLSERQAKDLAFAAARRCGWPQTSSPAVNERLRRFLTDYNRAIAIANARQLVPFVDEMTGWLNQIDSDRRDLFFYTS